MSHSYGYLDTSKNIPSEFQKYVKEYVCHNLNFLNSRPLNLDPVQKGAALLRQ